MDKAWQIIRKTKGEIGWYLNNKLHRVDSPAVEESDGRKKWYQDGILHREEGPAVESTLMGERNGG